ncbi:MAG: DUF1415 domain-containing protein [Bacteroidota bacterium]
MTDKKITEHTINWIKNIVIDLNFCPFAAKALLKKSIRYIVLQETTSENCLEELADELKFLDEHNEFETTFIILPDNFKTFNSYLTLVEKAEAIISENNYDGVYQLASFHPKYCFAGSTNTDAANYTNRSPYPMLHILREESVTQALKHFPHPEKIPERNIDFTREKGLKYMQMLRTACME